MKTNLLTILNGTTIEATFSAVRELASVKLSVSDAFHLAKVVKFILSELEQFGEAVHKCQSEGLPMEELDKQIRALINEEFELPLEKPITIPPDSTISADAFMRFTFITL